MQIAELLYHTGLWVSNVELWFGMFCGDAGLFVKEMIIMASSVIVRDRRKFLEILEIFIPTLGILSNILPDACEVVVISDHMFIIIPLPNGSAARIFHEDVGMFRDGSFESAEDGKEVV